MERGQMDFENLTPEQIQKADACETPEEYLALAQEMGYELTDEELESVAGGGWSPTDIVKKAVPQCPACGSYEVLVNPMPATGCAVCTCHNCGYQWTKTALDPILPS